MSEFVGVVPGESIGETSGSDATKALHESIEKFNETTTKQAQTIIRLTRVLVGLTIVLVFGLAVQIAIAL